MTSIDMTSFLCDGDSTGKNCDTLSVGYRLLDVNEHTKCICILFLNLGITFSSETNWQVISCVLKGFFYLLQISICIFFTYLFTKIRNSKFVYIFKPQPNIRFCRHTHPYSFHSKNFQTKITRTTGDYEVTECMKQD